MRVVKEYDERYNEFLDVAQALFYQKGYEQTSVQEIIRSVGVAKGTFYHYFGSKAELLDALIRRMLAETVSTLTPLLEEGSLGAQAKLERFLSQIGSWKLANREILLDALRVLYQDENVLLRTKMQTQAAALTGPILASIIRQGIAEGVFDMAYPDEAAAILIQMGQGLSESIVSLLLDEEQTEEAVTQVKHKIEAYNYSVERVLGAASGSLQLFPPESLEAWLPRKMAAPAESSREGESTW